MTDLKMFVQGMAIFMVCFTIPFSHVFAGDYVGTMVIDDNSTGVDQSLTPPIWFSQGSSRNLKSSKGDGPQNEFGYTTNWGFRAHFIANSSSKATPQVLAIGIGEIELCVEVAYQGTGDQWGGWFEGEILSDGVLSIMSTPGARGLVIANVELEEGSDAESWTSSSIGGANTGWRSFPYATNIQKQKGEPDLIMENNGTVVVTATVESITDAQFASSPGGFVSASGTIQVEALIVWYLLH